MKWVRRIAWGVTGVLLFLWLGYEDRSLSSVSIVAAFVAFTLGLEGLSRWTDKRPTKLIIWMLRSIIIGAIAGAIVGPIAVLLALLKISLHHYSYHHYL